MNDIIIKTYNFIDTLDNSTIIKELLDSKKKLLSNQEVITLVDKFNHEEDTTKLISIKSKLFEIEEYKKYLDNYNKLSSYILKISNQYKKYTSTRVCI